MMRFFWYNLLSGFLLLALTTLVQAQDHRLNNNIVVRNAAGQDLVYAWAGGANMPQYSDVDLNMDGKKDMVIFNREGRTFTTFINVADSGQIGYRYDPRYEANFDSCECIEWALLEDYNCDGREDIICGRGSGHNFRLYENVLYDDDSVGFVMKDDPMFSRDSTGFLNNLYQTRTDIPAIVDVDYDGDLDIIASQSGSANTWAWHRNYAVEDLGRCDTMLMYLETQCWGHFAESFFTDTLITPDTINCPVIRSGGGRIPDDNSSTRHVGGAMLVFDSNGDSLMDALIGDVSYPTAILAINGGILEDPLMVDAAYKYPAYDSSINVNIFPAFFYADVNLDGKRDLIVSPNSPAASENINASSLYLNMGRDDSVDFQFQGRRFLVDRMVDAGVESVPVFFDYDQDGLQDLLVAGDLPSVTQGDTLAATFIGMRLYRNVGTADTAAFQLVDSDYLGLGSLFPPPSRPVPTLADLDGDNDLDLFLGLGAGKILHYINMAGPGATANFVPAPTPELADNTNDDIDPGSSSAPAFHDLDGDGDLDLLVGNRFGYLTYYENEGSATSHSFTEVTNFFGKIRPQNDPWSTTSIYSKPNFIDYDQDGTVELIIGEVSGMIEVYENPASGLNPNDSLVRDSFLFSRDFGRLSSVTAAVIDSTGDLTWVIGNERGGLQMLNTLPLDTAKIITHITDDTTNVGNPVDNDGDTTQTVFVPNIPQEQAFNIYPNPNEGSFTLDWEREFPLTEGYQLRMYNPIGQEIFRQTANTETLEINLGDTAPGIYILQVQLRETQWTQRILIQ